MEMPIIKRCQPPLNAASKCLNKQDHRHFLFRLIITMLLISHWSTQLNQADDSQQFDLNSLASLASNLGSNPQVMGLMSSLLSQTAKSPSPSSPAAASSSGLNPLLTSSQPVGLGLDQSTNIPLDLEGQFHSEQATSQQQSNKKQQTVDLASKKDPSSTTQPQPQPQPQQQQQQQQSMSNLMSLLPNILPNLGNMLASKPQAKAVEVASAGNQSAAAVVQTFYPTTQSPTTATNSPNTAQSVINQVLTAYASGQIPNELIQLSLSGKIPPQIIELALSGQVPSQIIQMVITGQVPMSTINTFLATIQGSNSSQAPPNLPKAPPETAPKSAEQAPGLTRFIFEALFNRSSNKSGNSSSFGLRVPTLLGPVALPNVRRIGQIVGGTITNVASMIPF